jgi:hypothetical protein
MATSEETRKKISEAMKASHAKKKVRAEQRAARAARKTPPRSRPMKAHGEPTHNGHVVGAQLRIIEAKILELQDLKRLLTRHRGLLATIEE